VTQPEPVQVPKAWRTVLQGALSAISPGVLAGFVSGALVGGLGGRLAMFVLRLTSSDSLHGMQTDDDFTIGSLTGATLFLIAATAFLGILGGLLYTGVREWLPKPWRASLFGIFGAVVGGALVIRPEGIDFTALQPLSLAVALFIALPGVYGVIVSVLTERLIGSPSFTASRWRWVSLLLLLPLLATGPLGVGLLLLCGLIIAANRSDRVTRLWCLPETVWAGRTAFGAVLTASSVFLALDISKVL